ncbi:Solute carrier family 25 member 40-like [Oopsacas minuta]|uniref:Solute carrier family 25 member 40-like n=1 Tax=Oopsacas minuta TaxID=111878 RepID=A0AAV7K7K5_9METZ|nr:Solute carrier family 25 member 40-like [Oopsacas minuta]
MAVIANAYPEPKLHHLLIASSFGGICSGFITLPFDVLKVRLQSYSIDINTSSQNFCNRYVQSLCVCVDTCDIYRPVFGKNQFSSTYSMFKIILKETGPKGFWRGLTPTLIQSIPQVTTYYTLYQKFKHYFTYNSNISSSLVPAIAGVGSRTITCFMVAPLELFRTNLQSSPTFSFRNIYSSIKVNGYFSLWRGFSPMLVRDMPFTAIYWSGFELMKVQLQLLFAPQPRTIGDLYITFISGWVCGSVAAALTTPCDVLKTNIEVSLQDQKIMNRTIYKTILDIHSEFGIGGFFKGLIPRCAKIGPACAIMIVTFELVINLFNQ